MNKKRLFIILFAAVLLAIVLPAVPHDCCGDGCPVCFCINIYDKLVRSAVIFAVILPAAYLTAERCGSVAGREAAFVRFSPVTLYDKLSN